MAVEKWRLDIRNVEYPALAERIEKYRRDSSATAQATRETAEYLAQPNLRLYTERRYVENAFLLNRVFVDLMRENQARALTVQHCMGTIMPIADTTACLPLMLLNDEGYLAFCESDFIVIPIGFLMHHIAGTPVFLNDPTWPHHGKVTVAHCTAPRKMDGRTFEPAGIYTHFESDFGAAPKVEMRKGQVVTMAVPDFSFKKYVGFRGTVEGNPFHDICRSQSDIAIEGDWQRLLEDMRGFHWMMVYGDCRKEVGYALKRLGIEWEDISGKDT
jgi:L-fucose isomerase-like protein